MSCGECEKNPPGNISKRIILAEMSICATLKKEKFDFQD
jgi:hypothetical protein